MSRTTNFENGSEHFNIHLNHDGELEIKANDTNGDGDRRMLIDDDSGQVTVGGGGEYGAIQLVNPTGGNTIFIGVNEPTNEARAFLGGGGSGLQGRVLLGNTAGQSTIDLQGAGGNILLGSPPNNPGQDGDIVIRNNNGATTIQLSGSNGRVRCTSLQQTSDGRLKKSIAPLLDALDKVMSMRGVRYEWADDDDNAEEIGFIGQEVGAVYPELVATDEDGTVSLNYSRLTAVLVEAIKEQQRLMQDQASTLLDAMRRIAHIEAAVGAQGA
jgi:hypothetical protein